VSSRSGVATLRTAIHLLLTYFRGAGARQRASEQGKKRKPGRRGMYRPGLCQT